MSSSKRSTASALDKIREELERARAENVELALEEQRGRAAVVDEKHQQARKQDVPKSSQCQGQVRGSKSVVPRNAHKYSSRARFARSAAELMYDERKGKKSIWNVVSGSNDNHVVYDQDADAFRAHEKSLKSVQLRPVSKEKHTSSGPLIEQERIDALKELVGDQARQRLAKSGKRQGEFKDSDGMGINEKNRRFNRVAQRAYKDEAAPIRANLERGTALPDY